MKRRPPLAGAQERLQPRLQLRRHDGRPQEIIGPGVEGGRAGLAVVPRHEDEQLSA